MYENQLDRWQIKELSKFGLIFFHSLKKKWIIVLQDSIFILSIFLSDILNLVYIWLSIYIPLY